MKKLFLYFILTLFFTNQPAFKVLAAQNCSRSAYVNYQEVLVDTSASKRGEGLRYYLQKDPIAHKLLNKYQDNNRVTWKNAALSTVGSSMILIGLLRPDSSSADALANSNSIIAIGASLIAVSYLISRTKQYNNEYLLKRSVNEYNKRNSPKIYFATDQNNPQSFGAGFRSEF